MPTGRMTRTLNGSLSSERRTNLTDQQLRDLDDAHWDQWSDDPEAQAWRANRRNVATALDNRPHPTNAQRRPRRPEAPPTITPHWNAEPGLWERPTLDGIVLPGRPKIEGLKVRRKIDKRSAAGSDGGTLRDRGYELASFQIKLTLWTETHLQVWEELLPRINPRRRLADRTPLAIYTPECAQLGIDRVYVESVSGLLESSIPGAREATIELIEFRPASPTQQSVTRRVQPDPTAPVLTQQPNALDPPSTAPEGHL